MSINVYAESWAGSAGADATLPEDPAQPPRARTSPQPAVTSAIADINERLALRRTMIFMIHHGWGPA